MYDLDDESINQALTYFQIFLVLMAMTVSTTGVLAYICYVYIVRKYKSEFTNSFYTFTVSLSIPDFFINLILLVYSYPVNLLRTDPFPVWLGLVFGVVMELCWFVLISHVTVIATNRLVAVAFYSRINQIFAARRVKFILLACYIFAAAMVSSQYAAACGEYFLNDTWILSCDEAAPNFSGTWPLDFNMYVANGLVAYVVIANVLVVALGWRQRRRIQQARDPGGHRTVACRGLSDRAANERSLVAQCLLVSSVLTCYQCTFWCMVFLINKRIISGINGALISNFLAAANSATNPLVYFVFSSEVRRKVHKTIGRVCILILGVER